MKLKNLKVKNFRSYKEEVVISFEDLTAIVGTNDIGKSTILEALEIFFNNDLVKIESSDANVHSDDKNVTIICEFTDLPNELTLDSTSKTNLKDEYLVNADGNLEICKIYDCTKSKPTPKIYAIADHPTNEVCNNLLGLKNGELRKIVNDLSIPLENIEDLRSNVNLRKAIWSSVTDLKKNVKPIELNKEDAKSIWEQIEGHFPIYALFQSDRSSSDSDDEVQDPMKLAVKLAIENAQEDLKKIKDTVQNEVISVANRTLSKLKEACVLYEAPNFNLVPICPTKFN